MNKKEQVREILELGVRTGNELQRLLNISQANLSRILATMIARGEVLKLGAARSTRYALLCPFINNAINISVYEVDSNGNVLLRGQLFSLMQGQYAWTNEHSGKSELLETLPHWIQNMKPEGFMGRALAHRHAERLGLPEKLQLWTERHFLHALSEVGDDVPGNLILGTQATNRYLERSRATNTGKMIASEEDLQETYIRLAENAIEGDPTGSSAGGEQPKFATTINSPDGPRSVLVKFTKTSTDEGRRWSDLLVAEDIANRVMQDHSYITAETRIIQVEGWSFLESVRFDRNGLWGRLPLASLLTLDAEFVGMLEGWVESAKGLLDGGHILAADLTAVKWLNAFGECIGNTDRHLGNISFIPAPDEKTFHLAPVYDMTPMFYRPKDGGQMPADPIAPRPSTIRTNTHMEALDAAMTYWDAIMADERISAEFKDICRGNRGVLERITGGPRILTDDID